MGIQLTPEKLTSSPEEVLRVVSRAGLLCFDCETTGLNHRRDRVRLLQFHDGWQTVVLDCFEHDPKPIVQALRGKILVAHNALFDLGWLWQLGLRDLPQTICTYLLAQVLTAGEGNHGFPPLGLGACSQRWLSRVVDKELQSSDWSGPLSAEQLAYARTDVEVLEPLLRVLKEKLDAAGLWQTADVELRALPAFVWLAQSGVGFDREAWQLLAARAAGKKDQLEAALEQLAPMKGKADLFGTHEPWNWDSPQQVGQILGQLGFDVSTTADAQLAFIQHPIAGLLRQQRHEAQLVKMYGQNWLDGADIADGRLHPGWRQIGTASGRTSCKAPNAQQIPRDEDPETKQTIYRSCFKAPPGRVLVKADYSTLQMRIAAKWAQDQRLIGLFRENADVHTATARALLNKQEVTKHDRQIAKSANFALLFGASAEGLRIYSKMTFGIDFSEAEAVRHRTAWFTTYAGLKHWHDETKRRHVHETRGASGRRRLLPDHAPDTWRLNSPVQADEADGLKLALALLWERRSECPSAVPVLAVHDEIVIEVPTEDAEKAQGWLVEAMRDGMEPWLKPVPVDVEAKVLPTWGG